MKIYGHDFEPETDDALAVIAAALMTWILLILIA